MTFDLLYTYFRLGTYAANKGEIFCKTHFKMLFKIKGNYDEGFGREQHKAKWSGNNYTPSPEPHTLTQWEEGII